MLSALITVLERRINQERAPYVLITAGLVYLAAFNTVLLVIDIRYVGFLLFVPVVCAPPLLRAPELIVLEGLHGVRQEFGHAAIAPIAA